MQITVPLTAIDSGERVRQDLGDIDALVDSIKRFDVIQPLAVVSSGDGRYMLLAGGRRFEACKRAGKLEVPVRVYESDLSELDRLEIELEENVQRKDMTFIEEAQLVSQITEVKQAKYGARTEPGGAGWAAADTAQLLNLSQATVSQAQSIVNALKEYPDEIKAAKNKTEALRVIERKKEAVIKAELARRAEPIKKKLQLDNYIIADFFEAAPTIERGSVDLIEADPPWGIDYESNLQEENLGSGDRFKDWTPAEYEAYCRKLFSECFRILRSDRWMLLWGAMAYYELTLTLLREAGFAPIVPPAIWAKPGAMPTPPMRGVVRLASAYEVLFYAAKGQPIVANLRPNVFIESSATGDRIHPTEKPVSLMKLVLEAFVRPSQTVLVPFLGSGNTLLAAKELGVHAYGYDLSEDYRNAYITRLMQKELQK